MSGPVTDDTPPTYRALFTVAGFPRLALATLAARTGNAMQSLVLVLFVLQRFHSPPLAGLAVFVSLVPGILVSPLAGALLDRHRRMLLIGLDYLVAAASLVAIAGLAAAGWLAAGELLAIVALSSLTNPLSNSGTRSLFPVIVPRPLWERANAIDSGAYVVSAIVGPAVAGLVFGVLGAVAALLITAGLYLLSLLMLLRMAEPVIRRAPTGSLLRDSVAGLSYVVRHRQLRGLAVATAVSNVAYGIVTVGMPVLLLGRLHAGAGSVGVMFAVMGVAGLAAGLLTGRMDSEHREMWFVLAGCALGALAMAVLLVAAGGGSLLAVGAGVALFGIADGPFNIGLFSLRQRVTAPAWMGRAFAVSMSLNFVGIPVGSALAGPIVERSPQVAFALAAAVEVVAAVGALITLRPPPAGRGTSGDGYNSHR